MTFSAKKLSNNKLAEQIRENATAVLYHGIDVFCELWSSDIRELIKLLAEMLSHEEDDVLQSKVNSGVVPIIAEETQNLVLRNAGGHFLNLLETTTNPNRRLPNGANCETYGTHLKEIIEAFQKIAYYELKNKNAKNQDTDPPKQARKIELTTATGTFGIMPKIIIKV